MNAAEGNDRVLSELGGVKRQHTVGFNQSLVFQRWCFGNFINCRNRLTQSALTQRISHRQELSLEMARSSEFVFLVDPRL